MIKTIIVETKKQTADNIEITVKIHDKRQVKKVKKQIAKALAVIRNDGKRTGLDFSFKYTITAD